MEVRAFHPSDFLGFKLQPKQYAGIDGVSAEIAENLGASEHAYTVMVEGEVVACIGVIALWKGRRYAWAYMSGSAAPYFLGLTRRIAQWLRYHGAGRIETAIDPDFVESDRWATMLGFQREGRMREYVPGKDFDLYARVGR